MLQPRRWWVVLLVAVLAVTAGCTGGGGGDGGGARLAGDSVDLQGGPVPMATRTVMVERAAGSGDGGDYDAQLFAQRQLILTGQVLLEVDDFEAARGNLTEATVGYGGFVSDARREVHRVDNETWTTGVVVLRVPRDNFTALFDRVKTEGELLEENQESQDVTDQLVDLQARLDNLRAERDQLRELYGRANDTRDVLAVQERLSEVQGEIERLEARQQTLQQRVALSTITVRLAEPRPDRPIPDRWYDVPLLAAFLESVDGVVVTLRAIAVGFAYIAPYLVVFGVPLAAVGYVVRQRRGPRPPGRLPGVLSRRRGGEPDEPATEDEAAEAADEPPTEETENGTDGGSADDR